MKSKSLYAVNPDGADSLWRGDPARLPFRVVKNAMSPQQDPADIDPETGPEGWPNIGDAKKIHAELKTGVDTNAVVAWDDDGSYYFEWRDA